MRRQRLGDLGRHWNHAPGTRLRCSADVAHEARLDVDRGASEVDRSPSQVKQLAEPKPAERRHHEDHGVLPVDLGGGANERVYLDRTQEPRCRERLTVAHATRPVDERDGIRRDRAELHRTLHHAVEVDEVLALGPRVGRRQVHVLPVGEASDVRSGGAATLRLLRRDPPLGLEVCDPALEADSRERRDPRAGAEVATDSCADVAVVAERRALHLAVVLGPSQPLIARRSQRERAGRWRTRRPSWSSRRARQEIVQQPVRIGRRQIPLRLAAVAGAPTHGAAGGAPTESFTQAGPSLR